LGEGGALKKEQRLLWGVGFPKNPDGRIAEISDGEKGGGVYGLRDQLSHQQKKKQPKGAEKRDKRGPPKVIIQQRSPESERRGGS